MSQRGRFESPADTLSRRRDRVLRTYQHAQMAADAVFSLSNQMLRKIEETSALPQALVQGAS